MRIIADSDYQQRVWIEGQGNEISSYDDEIERFFDDYAADELLAGKWIKFADTTPKQLNALREFRDVFDRFDKTLHRGYHKDEDVLSNPEWERVREVARKTLAAWPST